LVIDDRKREKNKGENKMNEAARAAENEYLYWENQGQEKKGIEEARKGEKEMKNKKEYWNWLLEYFGDNEDMVVTHYDDIELQQDFREERRETK
jgi:hypothetical protein